MWKMAAMVSIQILIAATANGQSKQPETRAVILVIDKSGSMREQNRMESVKESAKSLARQLSDEDQFGVIGFDIAPFVVIYLERVERLRKEDLINTRIERLKPGGQTYFFPALAEAKRQIEQSDAGKKHIVLFSDGATRGSQAELIDSVVAMNKGSAIKVSAIAIGPDSDIPLMKRIAANGGGVFFWLCNSSDAAKLSLEGILSGTVPRAPDEGAQSCPN